MSSTALKHFTSERASRFYEALDWRLLDHATGSGIIEPEECEHFARTRRLEPLENVRVVDDAVAAAFADVFRNLPHEQFYLLLGDVREGMGLSRWSADSPAGEEIRE
jgi:hypothetical protein